MTDTLQRQALIRDLAGRLETAGPDELSVLGLVVWHLEQLRPSRPRSCALDLLLADLLDDARAERRTAEQRLEGERDEVKPPRRTLTAAARARFDAVVDKYRPAPDDDPAREWATESTVGTVCSDESLAIARTVTAERSDPYETVVVDVEQLGGEGG